MISYNYSLLVVLYCHNNINAHTLNNYRLHTRQEVKDKWRRNSYADFSFNCLHLSLMFFGVLHSSWHLSLSTEHVFNSGLLFVNGHSFSSLSVSSIVHHLLLAMLLIMSCAAMTLDVLEYV